MFDSPPSHQPRPRAAAHVLVLGLYLLGYYLFSYPALHGFGSHFLCDGGDGLQNVWNNWWVRTAVTQGQSPFFTDALYAPQGVSLIGATLNPFNGLLTIPLCPVFGEVAAYNCTVVLAFVLGGYTMFLLVRELTGDYWPSVFAGAFFTFSPYHFAHAIGHMQLVSLQWLPFFFWAWIRLLRSPSHGRAIIAATALLLNVLCDYYYTLFAIYGGVLLFAFKAYCLRRPLFFTKRSELLPLLTFVVASLATTGLILGALLHTQVVDPFEGSHRGFFQNDTLGWLIPGSWWRFSDWTAWFWQGHPAARAKSEFGSHLGLVAIALCITALARRWHTPQRRELVFWSGLGVLSFAFSAGASNLVHAGQLYRDVPMPFDLLLYVFPFLELSGNPVRMCILTYLATGIVASVGLGCVVRCAWWRPWYAVPLLALWAFEVWPQPQPTYRPGVSPAIRALAAFPPGIVQGFGNESEALWLQTQFRMPMAPGYIARVPASRAEYADELMELRGAGQYLELMQRGSATYLVLRRRGSLPVEDPRLKLIAADDTFDVFTWADSGLPAVPR